MTASDPTRSVLVVGPGLIGGTVAAALRAKGVEVTTASRTSGIHLETAEGRGMLEKLLRALRPITVVLSHGPTSPEWCHEHPELSVTIHAETASVVAESGSRPVLVSSDVVFDGVAPAFGVLDSPRPVTAYGRAKLEAEHRLSGAPQAAIVRPAMVYGNGPGNSFAERVLSSLAAGVPIDAPIDQFVSPVHADDVGEVVAAVVLRSDAPSLVHLGGPHRVSRFEFALEVARQCRAPQDLVRPVTRHGTRWSLRPKHSCLITSWLPPALAERGLMDPVRGLRLTVERSHALAETG